MLNASARFICGLRRHDHVSEPLISLQWVRVNEQVDISKTAESIPLRRSYLAFITCGPDIHHQPENDMSVAAHLAPGAVAF